MFDPIDETSKLESGFLAGLHIVGRMCEYRRRLTWNIPKHPSNQIKKTTSDYVTCVKVSTYKIRLLLHLERSVNSLVGKTSCL
jgi:hypothetical protein